MTTTTDSITHAENIAEARRIIKAHRGIITVGVNTPHDMISVAITKKEALGFYLETALNNEYGMCLRIDDDELRMRMEDPWNGEYSHPLGS